MEKFDTLCGTWSRIDRGIRIRADRLARKGAVPGMEPDDVVQDLRLNLLRRAEQFNPDRASFATYSDRVAQNRVATLAAPTARIRAERSMVALDAPIESECGDPGATLADLLPESAALHERVQLGDDHGVGLRMDVARLMKALPAASRRLAALLGHMSVAEAARTLGLHRSTVYDRLASIRAAATALGLHEYLGTSPTLSRSRR